MKRALALLVGGVLILGSALAAHAQAPTVSFGGQMRAIERWALRRLVARSVD